MTKIRYDHWRTGTRGVPDLLRGLIDSGAITDVCDVGGGANPALPVAEIEQRGLSWTMLDISQVELDKAPSEVKKVHADIADPVVADDLAGAFDLVFSNTLAEHVQDAEGFHRNVFTMLRPGGVAAHFMPTMYDPMFIANRLLPAGLSHRLVAKAQPSRKLDTTEGKFPAYYHWCRGPSERHLSRFRDIGYTVDEAVGYFGTGYLMRTPLHKPYEAATRALIKHPVSGLTSYAWLVLRKPS